MAVKELYLYNGVTIINGSEEKSGSTAEFIDLLESRVLASKIHKTTAFVGYSDMDESFDVQASLDQLIEDNVDMSDYIIAISLADEDIMNEVIQDLDEYIDTNFVIHIYALILTEDTTAGEFKRSIDVSDLSNKFDVYLNIA